MKNFEDYTNQRIEIAEKNIATLHLAENDVAIAIYADSLMETSRYDYYVIENYSTNPMVIFYHWLEDLSFMDAIIRESLATHLFLQGTKDLDDKSIELEERIFSDDSPIKEIYDNESLEKVLSLVSNPNAINCVATRFNVLCEGYKDKTLFDNICKTNNYKNLDYVCK